MVMLVVALTNLSYCVCPAECLNDIAAALMLMCTLAHLNRSLSNQVQQNCSVLYKFMEALIVIWRTRVVVVKLFIASFQDQSP